MDKDQESSSSIEASEEDEEAQSEHGSTTDAENEEINYWESLKHGILRFPAPLRLQSLLFIIGHLDQYSRAGATSPVGQVSTGPLFSPSALTADLSTGSTELAA